MTLRAANLACAAATSLTSLLSSVCSKEKRSLRQEIKEMELAHQEASGASTFPHFCICLVVEKSWAYAHRQLLHLPR